MIKIALIYLVVSLICFAILYLTAKFAPSGYEDENGFHYGTPDDNK